VIDALILDRYYYSFTILYVGAINRAVSNCQGDEQSSESNYVGLMRIWIEMQSVFCGHSTVHKDLVKKSSSKHIDLGNALSNLDQQHWC